MHVLRPYTLGDLGRLGETGKGSLTFVEFPTRYIPAGPDSFWVIRCPLVKY